MRLKHAQADESPLHCAVYRGHEDVALLLLKRGADVNAAKSGGCAATPLIYAAYNDHLEVARLLLLCGADVNASDRDGDTALGTATNVDLVRLLLERGADVNAQNKARCPARADILRVCTCRGARFISAG